jgi:dolichol-phosphate mannosyltransferase
MEKRVISIVIPVYNEEKNIPVVYAELKRILNSVDYDFEIIFVNDGSTDRSQAELNRISENDKNVKIIEFTRNFGKEAATSAGISICEGSACLLLDADLQHPVELIPEFLAKWEKGAEVVVGVRNKNRGEGLIKKIGSYLFYLTINKIAEIKITPHATDYRLLDKLVIEEFKKLTERNRMTRALIDWLGFKQDYVYFNANERKYGKPGYRYLKLVKLALSSYVAHSLFPLKLAGYLGIFITFSSGILGLLMLADKFLLRGPWKFNFSGPAMLAVAILFLVGIILICLGLIALYIGNIHIEVINRPMYVIKKRTNT